MVYHTKKHQLFTECQLVLCIIKLKNFIQKKPGKPTVFSNMQELAIVQRAIAAAAWGFLFDITDLRVLGKSILDI